MKLVSRLVNSVLFIMMFLTLVAAIGSSITEKPFLLTSVRSNSMYPLFQRSDMLILKNINSNDKLNIGDVVVFKSKEGSLSSKGWIVHRIIGGSEDDGFITMGDANEATDQSSGGNPPIKREWIASTVLTMGNNVLKIPLIGYLPLWVEKYQSNPYVLPLMAVFLAFIVGFSELKGNSKKRKMKNSNLELPIIYMISGITISVIMAGTMIATSQQINVSYEISESNSGILMGSNIGVLKVGDTQEKPIADLENKSFFPITVAITNNDEQISNSHSLIKLNPGDTLTTSMILEAKIPGIYKSKVSVGMFYPFLPSKTIFFLASKNYWLALGTVSLIPGLPLIIYPILDKKMRRKSKKEIKHIYRKISRKFPLFNNT